MDAKTFDMENIDIAWCPGCGNYSILTAIKRALAELEIDPKQLAMVSGIGQAAKKIITTRNCNKGSQPESYRDSRKW
jgi:pyruvate/2-oxoacid:ferredoxin oxidoreductase beta subunit